MNAEQSEYWRLSINGVTYTHVLGPDRKVEHVTGSDLARKTEETAKQSARKLQAAHRSSNVRLRLVTIQTVLYGEDD